MRIQATIPKAHNSMFCRPGAIHIHTERKFVRGLGYIRADATPRRSKRAVKEATYGKAYAANLVLLQNYLVSGYTCISIGRVLHCLDIQASRANGQISRAGDLTPGTFPKTKHVSHDQMSNVNLHTSVDPSP